MRRILMLCAVWAAPRRYIVMFRLPRNASIRSVKALNEKHTLRTQQLFGADDTIHKKSLTGYVATLTESTHAKLIKDPSVELVEEDHKVKISLMDALPMVTGPELSLSVSPFTKIRDWTFGRYYSPGFGALAGGRLYADGLTAPDRKPDTLRHAREGVASASKEPKRSYNFILQKNAPWGMSRISGHKHEYEYFENAGKAVNVYVLDTGIDIHHPEFEGRAAWGYNAVENSPDIDEHGHGTHCAGTIAGKKNGIAKYASLVAVKSLNSQGEGLISALIEGIEFVIKDHDKRVNAYYDGVADTYLNNDHALSWGFGAVIKESGLWPALRGIFTAQKNKPKAVVNMSIGGVRSAAVNFAVRYATEQMGIHFVTAAGNESDDACDFSPASSPNTITVGASGPDNEIAGFSNVGTCVDLYAPGVEILSAWPHRLMKSASGTSMAAPHVAGVMAVYLSLLDLKPKELRERIIKDSVKVIMTPARESPEPMRCLQAGQGYILEEHNPLENRLTRIEFWPFTPGDSSEGSDTKEAMVSLEELYKELKKGKLNKD